MDELEKLLDAVINAYEDYESVVSSYWPTEIKVKAAELKYETARQAILDYVSDLRTEAYNNGSRDESEMRD